MLWRTNAAQGQRQVAFSAITKIVFAIILLAFASAGISAEACPAREQAVQKSVDQNIEHVSAVIVSAAPAMAAVTPGQAGLCCSPGCPAGGAACGIGGACAASFATVNHLLSAFFLPAESTYLSPFDQAEIASAQPPPNLRPPRMAV